MTPAALDRIILAVTVALVALAVALAITVAASLLDRFGNKPPTRRVGVEAPSRRHFGLQIGSFEGREQ